MTSRFADRFAIVTGAGGDIGRAISVRLSGDGATVLVVDADAQAAEMTVAAVRAQGGVARAFVADVTDPEQVAEFARAGPGGVVDLLVNNAGIEGPAALLHEYPVDAFDRVMAVNVRGVFLGLHHVLPRMPRGAAVVNTASTGSFRGAAKMAAYIASKHAVIGLTKTAAVEAAERGVRVNAICPGPVAGRMMSSIDGAMARPSVAAHSPLGSYATPEEVASVAAFLLSDDASHVTGGSYPVDGGRLAS